jgi:hypothetical protein
LGHDSVIIAQGAIICGSKPLHCIMQPSFVETAADDIVSLQWFEQQGRTGYSRILVRQNMAATDKIDEKPSANGLLGYVVIKGNHKLLCYFCLSSLTHIVVDMLPELLCDLHTYLNLPIQSKVEVELSTANDVGQNIEVFVRELPLHPLEYFSPSQTVLEALNVMQTGISRIGVLTLDVSVKLT